MSRIAFDARKLADFGIGSYIRGLVEAIARLDSESAYFLLGDPERISALALGRNFRFVEERSPGYSAREQWSVGRTVRSLDADLFHSPHYVLPLGISCPKIVTVHDLIHLRFPEHRPRRALLYARAALGRVARKAAAVLAVSESTRRDLIGLAHVPGDRIAVTPNGVDARFLAAGDTALEVATRERLGVPPRFLLFVGNPKPHKNLPALLDAMSRLATTALELPDLVLVGGGAAPDPMPRGLAVRALGKVADDDLPALYRGALALVVPSLWEGFGLPALEAMACGTAVIASDRGGLPEVVGDAGLLFDPTDVGALAGAIERLLREPSRRAELATAGRRRAETFSWSASAEKTLAVYRRVLGEQGRAR